MEKFCDIKSVTELTKYMRSRSRLNNIDYLSQYTSLDAIIGILSTGFWYLGNPRNMNDIFEYKKYKEISNLNRVFYSSFIASSSETIGMWSMYAQPWEEGVMISIPQKAFLKWFDSIDEVYLANKNKQIDFSSCVKISESDKMITRVLYNEKDELYYKDSKNKHFKNPYSEKELAGYIKDSAWDYEKEVRLRIDTPSILSCDGLAVKVPLSILKQIKITKGPRYESKQISSLIPKNLKGEIDIVDSKFSEKLGWISCDSCKIKEDYLKMKKDIKE